MLNPPTLAELDRGLPRIYCCAFPVDMRKGFDSLARLARDHLGHDPLCGGLFLFMGRRRDRLKILYWDRDGYALWYKRLEEGSYRLPRIPAGQQSLELKSWELAMLLEGIDLRGLRRLPRYQLAANS